MVNIEYNVDMIESVNIPYKNKEEMEKIIEIIKSYEGIINIINIYDNMENKIIALIQTAEDVFYNEGLLDEFDNLNIKGITFSHYGAQIDIDNL